MIHGKHGSSRKQEVTKASWGLLVLCGDMSFAVIGSHGCKILCGCPLYFWIDCHHLPCCFLDKEMHESGLHSRVC